MNYEQHLIFHAFHELWHAPKAKVYLEGEPMAARDSRKVEVALQKSFEAVEAAGDDADRLAADRVLVMLFALKRSFGFANNANDRLTFGVAFERNEPYSAEYDLKLALEHLTGDDKTAIADVARALRKLADDMEARPPGALYKRDKRAAKLLILAQERTRV